MKFLRLLLIIVALIVVIGSIILATFWNESLRDRGILVGFTVSFTVLFTCLIVAADKISFNISLREATPSDPLHILNSLKSLGVNELPKSLHASMNDKKPNKQLEEPVRGSLFIHPNKGGWPSCSYCHISKMTLVVYKTKAVPDGSIDLNVAHYENLHQFCPRCGHVEKATANTDKNILDLVEAYYNERSDIEKARRVAQERVVVLQQQLVRAKQAARQNQTNSPLR